MIVSSTNLTQIFDDFMPDSVKRELRWMRSSKIINYEVIDVLTGIYSIIPISGRCSKNAIVKMLEAGIKSVTKEPKPSAAADIRKMLEHGLNPKHLPKVSAKS